jgi:hypothetical protein
MGNHRFNVVRAVDAEPKIIYRVQGPDFTFLADYLTHGTNEFSHLVFFRSITLNPTVILGIFHEDRVEKVKANEVSVV